MTATAARAQGALAIASLVAAVAVTVLLVATPVSSRPSAPAAAGPSRSAALPGGVKVEIRGGEPFVAYRLADRLTGAGAALGAVQPTPDGNPLEPETMIVYYDRGQQASAERVKALVGRGTLRHKLAFEPGVDVTIVLGKDLSRL